MSRVAIIGENSCEYVDCLIDIWNCGDCAVLIDWRIPFQIATNMMEEASVSKCYIERKFYDLIDKSICQYIELIPYEIKINSSQILPEKISSKFCDNYSHDEAVVIYSSGTTGKEKGIILSHFAINTNADAIIDYMCPTIGDCIYIAKPFTHASTLTGELLVAFKTRMKIVVSPTIVPPRYVFDSINKHSVTIICLNPTLLSMYINSCNIINPEISSLRKIYVSGAILGDNLYNMAKKTLRHVEIYNVYGLSEAGPRVSAQRRGCSHKNSVGKAIKGVEIKVVDENGSPVSNGSVGIVYIKTCSLFLSYVIGNNNSYKHDDWLNSGDLGYFDNFGELHIVGRVDDVINIGAHKIHPQHIEKIIAEIGCVRECVVVKVNWEGIERLCCLYVSNSNLPLNFKKLLGNFLMKHEIPRMFVKTDTLPTTLNGKISRKFAIDMLTEKIKGSAVYE